MVVQQLVVILVFPQENMSTHPSTLPSEIRHFLMETVTDFTFLGSKITADDD